MLLTGTYRRSVDEKQRIAIPKKLRTAFKKQDSASDSADSADQSLYIAPGTDRSLAIYTEWSFSILAKKLQAGSPTGQDHRAFSRMFFARIQRAETDAQGRIRLEPELYALAGLGSEVVLVGVGDRVEIWDAARWDEYQTEQQAKFDELAEAAFDPPRDGGTS